MNQITINFTPCSPSPENGYRVFYREVGDIDFIEYPDAFTSSPIIFQVEGPTDQPYEGYIISDCGEDVISEQVPFETVLCPPPEGCCDPIVIDAEAETVIPDGSGSGSSVGGEFLRLVFNVDMSGESLSDWNTFFGSSYFDQVVYSAGGTIVDLYPVVDVVIDNNLFDSNTQIVRVLDFAECVIEVQTAAFTFCTSLIEVYLPACETITGTAFRQDTALTDVYLPLITVIPQQSFSGCTSLINFTCPLIEIVEPSGLDFCTSIEVINWPNCTLIDSAGLRSAHNLISLSLPNLMTLGQEALRQVNSLAVIDLPSCTTVGDRAIRSANSLTTLNLPVCTILGDTTGDDRVFEFVAGETIVVTIPTALATDGDIAFLQANNSVTLILV